MKAFLDTNVFVSSYCLNSSSFEALKKGVSAVPLTIVVAEVVVDEVENCFQRDVAKCIANLAKHQGRLEYLLRRSVPSMVGIDPSAESSRYRAWFEKTLRENGCELVPYPPISHKEVVSRLFKKKKPFGETDRGYRDTLIWSCFKQVASDRENVAFISNNHKDFSDPVDRTKLHSGLRSELGSTVAYFYLNLLEFTDTWVLPRLQMLESVRLALDGEGLGQLNLRQWLHENLLDLLQSETVTRSIQDFVPAGGSIYPVVLNSIDKVRVTTARRTGDGRAIVRLEVTASVETAYRTSELFPPEVLAVFKGLLLGSHHSIHRACDLKVDVGLLVDTNAQQVLSHDVVVAEWPWDTSPDAKSSNDEVVGT